MSENDVLITGIGIVSSLGEGVDAHWNAFSAGGLEPVVDSTTFSPYTVHPLPEIDWGTQIPKRGDLRQMEAWQRLGTYAAGLALDDAGLKGDETQLPTMDMIIAAGGGERDVSVDTAILEASLARNDQGVLLNEKLTTELRPTLFLAQLSNLLAGNISIVHKVAGSSRTFMGEEGAGIAAMETAAARIRAGQASHVLVGGAFNPQHPDHLLAYELGRALQHGGWSPIWSRAGNQDGGIVPGSGAAFLVLESRRHARERSRQAYAAVAKVVSARLKRSGGDLAAGIGDLIDGVAVPGDVTVVSGVSGAPVATLAERDALAARPRMSARGFSSVVGHLKEAQFPFAIALAAMSIRNEAALPPLDPTFENPVRSAGDMLATTVGARRFEGAALVVPAR